MSTPRRPPVMWDQAATALMLLLSGGVIGLPNTAHEIFYAQEIGGAQWAGLDVADYVELGFTWGQGYSAKGAYKGYLEQFSEPGVYDPHAMFPLSTGPTIVYPQVILERLIDVHAPDYFQVEYFVYLAWTDRRIFSRCDGFISDGSDSTDPCSLYWQPDIVLPDALLGDEEPQIIEDLGLFTHVGLEQGPDPTIAIPNHNRSIAYRQYRERAKFLVVLDQADIPFDDHTLNFTFKLPSGVTADEACFATGPPDGDGRDATIVELSSMQLGGGWKQGDKPDLWSGDASQVRRSPRPAHPVWDIMDFTAHVVQRSRDPIVELESTEWSYEKNPAYRMRELIEGPWLRAHLESGAHSVCEVTFSLTIKRRNTYHILNYIVTQSLLVVLGWCTFGIAPSNVDSRLAITLTLLLAINVFQIVLVENLPEMGNLSRLQWFTVTNTLILALMAMESIIVCQCWKHEKRRQELEARIKELTNNQLAVLAIMRLQRAWRRKKQLDTWRRRAAAAASAHQLPRKGRLSPQGMVIRTSNPPGPSAVAPTQQVEPQAHAEGAPAVAAPARCSRRSRLDDWGDFVAMFLVFPVLFAVSVAVCLFAPQTGRQDYG